MSENRARLVYILIAATIIGSVWAASTLPGEQKKRFFDLVGVPAMPHPFVDTEAVLAWLECHRAGRDMALPCNVGYTRNPLNYPRTWLFLARSPISWDHTWHVAVIIEVLFFAATLVLIWPYPKAALLPMTAALASPPLLFALERANVDILLFLFLFLACLAGGWVAGGLITIAGTLKIYPIVAVVSIIDDRRRSWIPAALAVLLFGVFCLSPLANWQGVVGHHTQAAFSSFGHQVLPEFLGETLSKRGIKIEKLLRVSAVLIFAALMVVTSWLVHLVPSVGASESERDRRLIVCSMAVFLGCFAMGYNFDYRHIHCLLTIPALSAIASRHRWICLEGLYLALVLCGLWLTYDPHHTISRATQELVEWLLIPLSVVVGMRHIPVTMWRLLSRLGLSRRHNKEHLVPVTVRYGIKPRS